MVNLIISRIISVFPLLFLVATASYFLAQLSPIDPAEHMLGPNASQAQIEALRTELGLNRPVLEQYTEWISAAVVGDFGVSLYTNTPVLDSLIQAIPVTLSLTLGALAVAVIVGIPAGVLSALKAGRGSDRAISFFATTGQAVPNFWLAQLLIIFVALNLRWLPATGFTDISEGVGGWLRSIALPCIALGLTAAAYVARQTRSSMIGVLQQEYIRTALAKGLSKRRVVLKHALKNASIPIVTTISFQTAALLGGSLVVEQLFGMRGVGAIAIDAVIRRDPDVIQGVVVFSAVVVVVVNLALDITYVWLNPKVRPA
jgi:peptide/nickel transport system permease protein